MVAGGLPQHQPWQLRGRLRQALSIRPAMVRFGWNLVAGRPCDAEVLEVAGAAEIGQITAETERKDLVRVEVESADEPHHWRIRVTPADSAPVGCHRFGVLVQPVDSRGSPLGRVPVPVMMVVADEIEAVPESVAVGALEIGQTREASVLIRSRTGRIREVTCAPTDAPAGEVDVEPLDRLGAFRIRVRVQSAKLQTRQVRFRVTKENGDPRDVLLRVNYFGIEPGALVEPRPKPPLDH